MRKPVAEVNDSDPLDATHDAQGNSIPQGDGASADRELLFERLAVLNGFVNEETLEAARQQTDPSKGLADILVENGTLTEEIRRAIETLVEQHIGRHDGDSQKSLSALTQTVSYVQSWETYTVAPTQNQPDDNPSSTEFGGYELLHEIAKGGMGVVYKARHRKLNRIVALKMIRSSELAGEEQVRRFHSEAEAAAQLDHPGIVPVFEVGEANGQHFFSMAFVQGKSLHAKVTDVGPLAAKEAASLMRAVANAVEFAHDKGIVHRDIKPQNILLDEHGEPRVADFGLAKHVHGGSDLTAAGQVMGTPSYMAPEQASGKIEEVDASSDVYSVGATLYFLLTSRPPFQAASTMDTLRQVVDAEPAPPRQLNPDVPRDLETICLKCLRKESAKRYSSAADFADDLSRWLEKRPIVARPVTRAEKAWLWCRRRPAVASLLVAMVSLAVVGAIIVKRREHQQESVDLVQRLVTAETDDAPDIVDDMELYWTAVTPLLEQAGMEAEKSGDDKALLHVRLALVRQDVSHANYLLGRLLNAGVEEVPAIIKSLLAHSNKLKDQLWQHVKSGSHTERLRAAAALSAYAPANEQWEQIREDVVTAVVSAPASESDDWIESLRPVGSVLVHPLKQRFEDRSEQRTNQRPIVAAALSVYLHDKPKILTPLILLANQAGEFQPLLAALSNHRQSVIPKLQSLVSQSPPKDAEPDARDAFWKKQANAAVCLLELGKVDSVWPLFSQTPDPSLRSFIIDRLARLGATPEIISARIKEESDPASRYALILALGQFDPQNLSSAQSLSFANQLAALYRDDPDPGVHSAAGWTLRNWQLEELADKIDHAKRNVDRQEQQWFANSKGQTFAVISGPVEFMTNYTEPQKATISHSFALATHEVTVVDFQRFRSDHTPLESITRESSCPVTLVNWYDAIAYCNWLNEEEGIPHDEWCYQPNMDNEYAEGAKVAPDFLSRRGYRLPTDKEWEYVCRAGTTSAFGFGEPVELLRKYAWYQDNAESRLWPAGTKLPNRCGAYDMHGNVWEWIHGSWGSSEAEETELVTKESDDRTMRGGSFDWLPELLKSRSRLNHPRYHTEVGQGFRVARSMIESTEADDRRVQVDD